MAKLGTGLEKMNSTNMTTPYNDFCNFNEPGKLITKRTVLVTSMILCSVGLLSNVFVILVALKLRIRRKTHYWIIYMAAVDCFLIALVFAKAIGYDSILDTITGKLFQCKALPYLLTVLTTITIVTLLIMSIERYKATQPLINPIRVHCLKRRVALFVGLCVASACFSSYMLILLKIDNNGGCSDSPTLFLSLWATIEDFFVFISVVVIFVLSAWTLRRLTWPQIVDESAPEQQNRRTKRRINVVNMVLFSLMLYFSCNLPSRIFNVILTFSLYNVVSLSSIISPCLDWDFLTFILYEFLPLLNSTFSPFIYIVFLGDFRKKAKMLVWRNQIQPRG